MIRKRAVRVIALTFALLSVEITRADSAWQFVDIDGVVHQPFADKATRAIALIFVATDCPIANSYQPLLGRMAINHADHGIRFFMIHSDPKTQVDLARNHQVAFAIQVPVVLDTDKSIARRVGATVTPQAVVIVRNQSSPAYLGRIDDRYADYGKKRTVATMHDFAAALDAIVVGKAIVRSRTEAIGCHISFADEVPMPRAPETVDYDPLRLEGLKVESLKLTIEDNERSREIPVLIYLPEACQSAPVVVHSHGLGGNRETSAFLGNHWAARGYVVVFVQHPGSDDTVWKNVPQPKRMIELRKAANGRNLNLRIGDVKTVIDTLEQWNSRHSHPLRGCMDLNQIGISGHSFGALTTQHLGGQQTLGSPRSFDTRIRAAIPMSPSSPTLAAPENAFGKIEIPWLCMTGTQDVAPIGNSDVESRMAVFTALPPGDKYELVLKDAEHSVFTERALPGEVHQRNPNHHRAIKAVTTAFWDSFLRDNNSAKTWLDGDQVSSILESGDRWQRK